MSAQKLRIGILRLLDCAPPIIASAHGFFADAGLDVSIVIEPSWANIADKLAYGLLDAAVMLAPLAVAMSLGLRGRPTALRLAATLSREGNAIVLDPALADAPDLAAALRAAGNTPRFAVVHAFSNHDLLLRAWLAGRGVSPEAFGIVTLPPADMAAALATGAIGGFCVGAPWGAMAARDMEGTVVATSAAIAPLHPEKFVVVRADIAADTPMIAAALRDALGAATALCRAAGQAEVLATLLADPAHLALPEAMLAEALRPAAGNPLFMTGTALRPTEPDLRWTTGLMQRAGHFADTDPTAALAMLGHIHN